MPFTLQVAPLIIGYMLYSLQSLLQVNKTSIVYYFLVKCTPGEVTQKLKGALSEHTHTFPPTMNQSLTPTHTHTALLTHAKCILCTNTQIQVSP